MQIKKLIKQFGTYGNEYSLTEVGDKINELIDSLSGEVTVTEEKKNYTPIEIKSEGMAVRSLSTQDMVYFVKDGKKHWIKNPETLKKLGFDFHKVRNITNEEMTSYETGKPIDLKEPTVQVPDKEDGFDKYNL